MSTAVDAGRTIVRYSSTRKQETSDQLLRSSAAVAKESGFGTTGVDALMASIGLTGGAFYSHFRSKDDLFVALIEREMEHSVDLLGGTGESSPDELVRCLRDYLGLRHVQHPEAGCALTALGPEIARGRPEARAAVDRSLRQLQRAWRRRLGGDGDRAWVLMAQCVGAIVLARAAGGERTRRQLLAASRRSAEAALGPD